jgi:DNA polymerase III epsilon subunit family exonuclease
MPTPPNLVSDSVFVAETVEMLRACGGRARVEAVAEHVLQVPCVDPATAQLLVSAFVEDDRRIRLGVVVDVETTGSKMPPCRVVEIGAYRVRAGRIVAEFETLVNPRAAIPPFISSLTGITDAMVARAPDFEEIAHNLLDFVGTSVLVAHNSSFDVRSINYELARLYPGRKLRNAALCTVSLSRRVVPALSNYRLHTVAEHFAVTIHNRHRAPGDARATAEIFIRLLALLRENGVRDVAGARQFGRA